jgi:hypothetical protein
MKTNWYTFMQSPIRLAAKSSDIQALQQWLQAAPTLDPLQAIQQLRMVLGSISKNMNNISLIFKNGVRSSNPEVAQQAAALLPDIANIQPLKATLAQTTQVLSTLSTQHPGVPLSYDQSRMDETATAEAQQKLNNLRMSTMGMLHMLMNTNFSPEQAQTFQQIAGGQAAPQSDYADEVNASRMNQFLQNSIYSTKNPQERTLRVIREVLQNAVDATLKRSQSDPAHKPQVDISIANFQKDKVGGSEVNIGDIIITDNGVGMDWSTIAQKFFVYFSSGKGSDVDAAGGFGIAKALIQEVPDEGWSLDTNGVHSSRFGKNMYMGTKQPSNFRPPQSNIIAAPGGGTSLVLYKLPLPYDYTIQNLCKQYATSGTVAISVNHKPIKAEFVLGDMTGIDSSLGGIDKAISENSTESEIIHGLIDKHGGEIANSLGDLSWNADGTQTSVQFFMRRAGYSGQLYVMLNNQFQFVGKEYFTKADVVCNVRTTARPGTEAYPVDAGRENLREPYASAVQNVVSKLREFLDDLGKNELFKQGLSIYQFNKTGSPMNTTSGESAEATPDSDMGRAVELGSQLKQLFQQKEQQSLGGAQPTPQNPSGGETGPSEQLAKTLEEVADSGMQGGAPMDDQERAVLRAFAQTIREERDDKMNVQEKLNEIMEGLATPCNIAVQKNFVSEDLAHNNPALTTNLSICWQQTLKMIMDKVGKRVRNYNNRDKKFVPGLIYSDECLALYMPPQQGMDVYTIAINPISIAAIAQPKLFEEKLLAKNREEPAGFKDGLRHDDTETPVNKLATFIFHSAVHEMAHLLFPDYSSSYEQFHMSISYMEKMCHSIFPQVRAVVKQHAQAIKKNSDTLIRLIARDRKKQMATQQPQQPE